MLVRRWTASSANGIPSGPGQRFLVAELVRLYWTVSRRQSNGLQGDMLSAMHAWEHCAVYVILHAEGSGGEPREILQIRRLAAE